jgi:sugar lactone lactonase YvrE
VTAGTAARSRLEKVADGFAMAEGPRWKDGAIVLTDIHADAIKQVDVRGGVVTTLVELDSPPISTGFMSDGSLLISSLTAQRVWRYDDGALDTYADLSGISEYDWGDIVVDAQDRVYIANQGISYPRKMPEHIDSRIYLLSGIDGPQEVAAGFLYANGLAISPDGEQLIVAESFGHRLWRLPILDNGSLGARTLIAEFTDADRPDGICCDAEGAVWSANATGREVVRCAIDGSVTDRISTGTDLAIGCILGGADGRDLYITTAPTAARDAARELLGSALWRVRVQIPAGGRP